jgi:SPP1 gp7 family putative phage head morphogenesis protein
MWFEAQLASAAAAQFNDQRDQILAHLDTSKIGKSYGKKIKGKQPTYTRKDWLQDLIDWAAASASFAEAIKPIVHATLLQAGRDATQDLGIDAGWFDPFTPAIVEYFQNRSTKIAEDVTDETEKQLRASLSQGVLAGESTFELRARVEAVMGSASTMRADNIARYEVTHAQTYGDIQAWTQSGVVEGKEWYTAHDEHVCPGCSSMDGKILKLSENFFDKGDELIVDRPGKDTPYRLKLDYENIGGCPLHNRCRCVLLPVRA